MRDLNSGVVIGRGKMFHLSIKPIKDCYFSRRNGIRGLRIWGYSIYLMVFRREIF